MNPRGGASRKRRVRRVLFRAIRRSFPRLARLAPSLSARLAEVLFRTPPLRRPRLKREQRVLDGGEFSRTPFLSGSLPTWTWGKGPAVLLVHGWGGHAGRLTLFVRALTEAGFSVVAFDAPGHGTAAGRVSSLPEFVAAIRAVAATHGPFRALIGHSLGAAAAALAVREGLAARRLVLLAPPSDLERYTGRFARIMRIPPTVRDSMKERLEKRFQVRWAELRIGGLPASSDVSLLVFHDRRDIRVPLSDGVEIVHSWPNARLVRTRGLGHHRILRDARVISRAVSHPEDSNLVSPRTTRRSNMKSRAALGKQPVRLIATTVVWAASVLAGGCAGGTLDTRAADQAATYKTDYRPVDSIQTPEGFRAVLVAEGFNYPSSMTWDAAGRLYVLESHTVPIPTLEMKVMRIGPGKLEEIALSGAGAPTGKTAIGIEFHDGWIYLSHEEKDGTWGISRFRPDTGDAEPVLRGLPGNGDHNVNYLVFDRQGTLYFGIGSATNSGVVSSKDPVNQKWLKKRPQVHDVPCRDLVLTRLTFTDSNELTPDAGDEAQTGAYQAYGRSDATRVAGERLCTSSIYKLRAGAKEPELVAWGFRNPVALALDPKGALLVGMHGADVRSTRPVLDDPDAVYRVRPGTWYGWPDYSADLLPLTDAKYRPPEKFLSKGHTGLSFAIDHRASGLGPPDRSLLVTTTVPHAALGGMTVVPARGPFARWAGQLLISEMGDFKPTTDAVKPDEHAGFQVESVDLATGSRAVFARNRGAGAALPASRIDLEEGFERPVDVKVGPDGLVYVLDFGVFNPTDTTTKVFPKTGRVYRIEPTAPK